MPKPIDQLTTTELVSQIDAGIYDNAEIVTELQFREVPNDYPDEAMRGGIRPTHLPTH